MRLQHIVVALCALVFALASTSAFAELKGVRLTKDQVLTACGSHYEESNGLGGCTIPCAGGKTCDFSCGGDRCSGRAERLAQPGSGKPEPAFLMQASQVLAQYCPTIGTAGECGIPCDPFLCKIFCGGRSYCVVTMERQHGKVDAEPQNLGATFSSAGGGTPVGVPVLQ